MVVIAAVAAITLPARPGAPPSTLVAARYAATWNHACASLRSAAHAAAAEIRTVGADRHRSTRDIRRRARVPAERYLDRTTAILAGLESARPPGAWAAYHARVRRTLDTARRRTAAARRRVAAGELSALSRLDLSRIARTPDAPRDLLRHTPACTGRAPRPTTPSPATPTS